MATAAAAAAAAPGSAGHPGAALMQKVSTAFPDFDNMFSTRQVHLEDVPSLGFNIRKPASQLSITTEARLDRARALAPVLIGERRIPVLVLANPFTEETTGASRIGHHSIIMYDPRNHNRKVKLFFRDTDGYYAGFQRCVVVEHEDTKQENWGQKFFFDDLVKKNEVPSFFEPVKMGIDSSHSKKGDFPGPEALLDTFNLLFRFEDAIHVDNNEVRGLYPELKKELKIAVARIIIVFCEAMRIRRIYNAAYAALGGKDYSRPLNLGHWNIIWSWGKISNYVLKVRRFGQLDLENKLDPKNADMGFLQ